jgi:hypothetical protein
MKETKKQRNKERKKERKKEKICPFQSASKLQLPTLPTSSSNSSLKYL